MSGISREDLARWLIESELMAEEAVHAFLASLPPDRDAGQELVSRNMLTDFQASALGSGELRTLVLGNYVVQEKLGRGGMGVVFLAKHRHMKRIVALKTLAPRLCGDPDAIRRFQREVEVLSRLKHPHIATAYDAGESHGIHYLAMEYVDGWNLSSLVRREGVLPLGKGVDYLRQAARGLAYAHQQGVIHRDVKPSNLLVDREGTVKVLDLGLARLASTLKPASDDLTDAELTSFGDVLGTASYMSPEQGNDTRYADERSDVYSLGCTLHYLLTGRPVFEGETTMQKLAAHRSQPARPLRDLLPEVPAALDELFLRMVEKRPEDRFQSMGEVLSALEDLARDPEFVRLRASAVPAAESRRYAADEVDPGAQTLPNVGQSTIARRRKWLRRSIAVLLVASAVSAGMIWNAGRRGGPPSLREEARAGAGELNPSIRVGLIAELPPAPRQSAWIETVAFAPDGERILTGGGFTSSDPETPFPVLMRRLPAGELVRELAGPVSWVNSLNVSRDGRLLLAASGGSWKVEEGRRPGGTDCSLFVWDLETGRMLVKYAEHVAPVRCAVFLPDGRRAVSGGHDSTIRLWSTETGEELALFENPFGEVLSVAVSPDGRTLACGHWNNVSLWDVNSREPRQQLPARKALAIAFSPDRALLVYGGEGRVVKIWETEGWTMEGELSGHEGRITGLAWHPDSRRLVSSSDDQTVRVWDVPTGRQIVRFDGHRTAVRCVAVSPDGSRAVSGGEQGTVRLWRLPADDGEGK